MNDLLIEILAATDALWTPFRSFQYPLPTVYYEGRKAFEAGGVTLPAGDGATARKRHQLALEAAAGKGLVRVSRRRGRHPAVKLSDRGEARARALCALPDFGEAFEAMQALADAPAALERGTLWASELALAGISAADTQDKDKRQALVRLEEKLLPALARRLVEAGSTSVGWVYYSLTASGRAALEADTIAPEIEPADVEPDADGARQYYEAFAQALEDIRGREPNVPGELGYMPLPCSMPAARK